MTWNFRVAYGTVVGESLWLEMSLDTGAGAIKQMVSMKWRDAGHWEVEVKAEVRGVARLEYNYVYKREGMEADLKEWGGPRVVEVGEGMGNLFFLDDWRSAGTAERVYEGKLFQAVEGGARTLGEAGVSNGNHELNLYMVRLPDGQVPCVMGGLDALGDWNYEQAVPLVEVVKNLWRVRMNLPTDWRIEYKYALYDPAQGKAVRIEDGPNRVLEGRDGADLVRVSDEGFGRSADLKFRGAGVAVPVFSLRSRIGCGVGEFADLKAMADWAAGVGLKMIQILPINDTTSTHTRDDSYPYSAISVFALHPIYLRLDELSFPVANKAALAAERARLNEERAVEYEEVMAVKWRVTREIFDKHYDTIMGDAAFLEFLKKNWDWVLDYGVFSVKRDEFGTAEFSKWGEWAVYDSKKAESESTSKGVMFYVWLQYELDRQLTDAVAYMHSLGVALKGDLPIGVDRDSVDAWVAPHLFKMRMQTGAPPDAFAVRGQNWGFPTYNWEVMKLDGYAWWRSRFAKLSRYFDAYRIDHILGFFRIWQIPVEHLDGVMGHFEPALPVRLEEFQERGIEFDYNRFCRPYIREEIVVERFGDFADALRRDFLEDLGFGYYGLKEEFSKQVKIQQWFGQLGEGDWANQQWLQDALMELVTEVLFFEVFGSNGTEFHPRMTMTETRSFRDLPEDVRWRMEQLYVDYFFRRQEGFWEEKAYEKLPAMRAASEMLLCGEDLGMVPACVPGVMARLGILSLEIQRMPKSVGSEFFDPAEAPYMSVVSPGTHDMATLRGWWREDEAVRARFAWEMFGIGFPEKELSGEMARRIIEQHLYTPAMLAVFPLQDLLAMDEGLRCSDVEGERINIPAVTPFYWKWRMHMGVEELAEQQSFAGELGKMVKESGR